MSSASQISTQPSGAIARAFVLVFGLTTYAVFLATFVYVIGFVGGGLVPKTIDDGPLGPVSTAILVNVAFLGLFGIQHTIMARPAFKRWFTRFVPAAVERSIFVAVTCAILIGMVVFWRPIPGVVWHVEGVAAGLLYAVSGLGWGIVLLSTYLIDHYELFGVKQVIAYARGREVVQPQFVERFLYRFTRHPLMFGFLVAFWATPHMTFGHLLFASVTTAYIVVALFIEERTLVELHGDAYRNYQQRVPKLIPGFGGSR